MWHMVNAPSLYLVDETEWCVWCNLRYIYVVNSLRHNRLEDFRLVRYDNLSNMDRG